MHGSNCRQKAHVPTVGTDQSYVKHTTIRMSSTPNFQACPLLLSAVTLAIGCTPETDTHHHRQDMGMMSAPNIPNICLQVIACASASLACVPALSTYHQRQDCTEDLLYELDVRAYVR